MICQYCGGENDTPLTDLHGAFPDKGPEVMTPAEMALESIRSVYWRWSRGIGKSGEVVEFTKDLGEALGEYKGDGSNG